MKRQTEAARTWRDKGQMYTRLEGSDVHIGGFDIVRQGSRAHGTNRHIRRGLGREVCQALTRWKRRRPCSAVLDVPSAFGECGVDEALD